MHFLKNVFAWVIAGVVAYLFASAFSTHFVLAQLVELGAPVAFSDRLSTTIEDIQATIFYGFVITAAFAIAFYVASIAKVFLPLLARGAYPIAGASAIWLALTVMEMQFDIIPISGAQSQIGFAFQILAGILGGLTFELLRPKTD